MANPQTENTNMNIMLKSGWIIGPLNFQLIDVAPPVPQVGISEYRVLDPSGGFELVHPSQVPTIDTITHLALLDESLKTYEGIWRVLAER